MIKPVAVLISDVHYSVPTLKLADAAMRQAITTANELCVPLIVAGDLHDTKANLRGECVNAMLETFSRHRNVIKYVLRGNHDAINEKSKEHSLNFLRNEVILIDIPRQGPCGYLIPYHYDPDELRVYLKTIPKGSTIIMHQGITGSKSGDYIQDKSAILPEDVAGLRVISGHYHARQTISLPDGGQWDYVGNPYTLTYGEANDPPKGFQILMSDGSLKFVPTNLRKHIVVETDVAGLEIYRFTGSRPNKDDLLWVKITDTRENLSALSRKKVSEILNIESFKLDLIPIDTKSQIATKNLTQGSLLDSLIDSLTNTSDDRKVRLKDKWKTL